MPQGSAGSSPVSRISKLDKDLRRRVASPFCVSRSSKTAIALIFFPTFATGFSPSLGCRWSPRPGRYSAAASFAGCVEGRGRTALGPFVRPIALSRFRDSLSGLMLSRYHVIVILFRVSFFRLFASLRFSLSSVFRPFAISRFSRTRSLSRCRVFAIRTHSFSFAFSRFSPFLRSSLAFAGRQEKRHARRGLVCGPQRAVLGIFDGSPRRSGRGVRREMVSVSARQSFIRCVEALPTGSADSASTS